jgi:hypothetical protein
MFLAVADPVRADVTPFFRGGVAFQLSHPQPFQSGAALGSPSQEGAMASICLPGLEGVRASLDSVQNEVGWSEHRSVASSAERGVGIKEPGRVVNEQFRVLKDGPVPGIGVDDQLGLR